MNSILLTFDIEDWFQVENFKDYIPFDTWSSREQRVRANTIALLDLLDNAPTKVNATFFILGWVAEHYPDIVKEISTRGHEIASHGHNHKLCYQQSLNELFDDLVKSKNILEDITGQEVYGYRAPSFSITDDALKVIQDVGYKYDSSYNSFNQHGRYGSITLPDQSARIRPLYIISQTFYEIPVSNLQFYDRVIPWGGGGYFRLLPTFLYQRGVRYILQRSGCYTFYMHPWEIDPDQPKVKEAKPTFRFRHYINLKKTKNKLSKLIAVNGNCNFISCRNFIETHGN